MPFFFRMAITSQPFFQKYRVETCKKSIHVKKSIPDGKPIPGGGKWHSLGSDNQGGKISLATSVFQNGLHHAQVSYKIRSYVRNNLVYK